MSRILGYGEDVLTLWALSNRLGEFLAHPNVDDPSSVDTALVIYRPSFGRGSRRANAGAAVRRTAFGEFDAIVATNKCVYLIESKWEYSSEKKRDGSVRLRPEQVKRHEIFEWHVREWWKDPQQDWRAFATPERANAFSAQFSEYSLAVSDSRLSGNLSFVLKQLAGFHTTNIQHVLLFFHFDDNPGVSGVENEKFVLVPFQVAKMPESMYLEITCNDLISPRAGVF